MGVWNSHTSVGNILGSLLAGVWVNEQWGLSFVVPGAITATMGIVTFLFLIECESRGRRERALAGAARLRLVGLGAGCMTPEDPRSCL